VIVWLVFFRSIIQNSASALKEMDLTAVEKLVRQGEGMHIEFKLKATHPEKIVREIVAFANTQGGTLLIGVSDDRQIKGLKFVDEEEFILTKAIDTYCHPRIPYQLHRVSVTDERELLALVILPGSQKPHYVMYDLKNQLGKVYVRVADRSIQASKEMREVLKGERKQRDIRFQYGEKEKTLLQYLGDNRQITVDQFAELANIPRHTASRTLVLLSLAHVLKITPHETGDFFTLATPEK